MTCVISRSDSKLDPVLVDASLNKILKLILFRTQSELDKYLIHSQKPYHHLQKPFSVIVSPCKIIKPPLHVVSSDTSHGFDLLFNSRPKCLDMLSVNLIGWINKIFTVIDS